MPMMQKLRRDAPFFAILVAILITAVALVVATVALLTRM